MLVITFSRDAGPGMSYMSTEYRRQDATAVHGSTPNIHNKKQIREEGKNLGLAICLIMKLFEPPLSRIITGKVPQ